MVNIRWSISFHIQCNLSVRDSIFMMRLIFRSHSLTNINATDLFISELIYYHNFDNDSFFDANKKNVGFPEKAKQKHFVIFLLLYFWSQSSWIIWRKYY